MRKISGAVFQRSKLKDFQFLNGPEKPLNGCSESEIDDYISKLVDEIIEKMCL